MSNVLDHMLSYLANVSDEQFQEDWAKVSELEDEGPTLEEYLALLKPSIGFGGCDLKTSEYSNDEFFLAA